MSRVTLVGSRGASWGLVGDLVGPEIRPSKVTSPLHHILISPVQKLSTICSMLDPGVPSYGLNNLSCVKPLPMFPKRLGLVRVLRTWTLEHGSTK